MGGKPELTFDEIGYWSELKLEIIKDYAAAYSKILAAQRDPELHHVYIDGFAGPGLHVSRATGGFVPGSPLNRHFLNRYPPGQDSQPGKLRDPDGRPSTGEHPPPCPFCQVKHGQTDRTHRHREDSRHELRACNLPSSASSGDSHQV